MDIIAALRSDSVDWLTSLTGEEMHAIRKYSYNSFEDSDDKFYHRLNAMLRGEIGTDAILEKYAKLISSGLKKYKTKRSFTCYRRVNVNPVEGYSIGSYFTLDQFISTSVIKTRTLAGNIEMVIHVPINCHAAYIEQLSFYPKQREVLLDKDCIYRLLSIKGNVLELEVIS